MKEVVGILATGYFASTQVEENRDLEKRLGLEPGWAARRTGIRTRQIAAPELAVSDLAFQAGFHALSSLADFPQKKGPGLLILATSTPDYLVPPTAPAVAHRLGLAGVGAFDLMGACSGFLYGLAMAESHCQVRGGWALVIGANILSRRTDPDDVKTAALFADGAGAVLIGKGTRGGLLGQFMGSNGSRSEDFKIPEGGSRAPFGAGTYERKGQMMRMVGAGFFRQAVREMAQAGERALSNAGLNSAEIDVWIPHQAGERLIRETGRLLGIGQERTLEIYPEWGNTSAASIAQALALGKESGRLKPGMRLLLTAVGAGMLSAGQVWEL